MILKYTLVLTFFFIYINSVASGPITTRQTITNQKPSSGSSGIIKTGGLPLGLVNDQKFVDIQDAFKFAFIQHAMANRTLETQLFIDVISTADAFKLSRIICNHLRRGVITLVGSVTAEAFDVFHSYANTFQMPFLTPWTPEKVRTPTSGSFDYVISMRPDYHQAVLDVIRFYGWTNIFYIYDSQDGLLRLQQVFQSLRPQSKTFNIASVKQVSSAEDVIAYLTEVERFDRWSVKHILLDCTAELAKKTLIAHVRHVYLGRRNYHYFLTGLVMDDAWEKDVTEYGAINVTGFRLLDNDRKYVKDFHQSWQKGPISANAALMFDGIQVFIDAMIRLVRRKPDLFRQRRNGTAIVRSLECDTNGSVIPWEHGEKVSRAIKRTEIEGLTGTIRFNENGRRHNFTLYVVELQRGGDMVRVASWYDYAGLVPCEVEVEKPPKLDAKFELDAPLGLYNRNKTYIVATILEAPYIMHKEELAAYPPSGILKPYRGFCVDIARAIANKMDIRYDMRAVRDGKYGKADPKVVGGWTGMVGEVVRKNLLTSRGCGSTPETQDKIAVICTLYYLNSDTNVCKLVHGNEQQQFRELMAGLRNEEALDLLLSVTP